MRILLTNDDGINAQGLSALYAEMKKLGQVTVVAPDVQRSAVGHAITLSDPLRVTKVNKNGKFFGFAVSGTPADCVKIACMALLEKKPDVVVSGINLGPNVGISVLYSGTVCGATEGAILGVPSIAVSLACFERPDYSFAARFAKRLAKKIAVKRTPKKILLNVNIPAVSTKKIKGIKITRQGIDGYEESYEKRIDPRKQTYYWLTGGRLKVTGGGDIDVIALRRNYISITPIHYDMTDYVALNEVKRWKI